MSKIINVASLNQTDYEVGHRENKRNIFAGNLSLGQDDKDGMIAYKKGFAQKQAMKLIGDAWDRDKKSSQKITDIGRARENRVFEFNELKSKIKDIEENKTALQEEYGIDSDSQEQKDLEILQKFQNYKGGLMEDSFTMEEIDRLRELQNMDRTEYQNKVLKLNAPISEMKLDMNKLNNEIRNMNQSVYNEKMNQLKSQDMLNAQNAADSIIETSNKEILGMLVQEGLDKIEEDRKEEEKKSEEATKKKEEQQEKINNDNENKKEQDEIIKSAADSDRLDMNITIQKQTASTVENAQKNIQKILKENNLIEEDLKGIKIDFNF